MIADPKTVMIRLRTLSSLPMYLRVDGILAVIDVPGSQEFRAHRQVETDHGTYQVEDGLGEIMRSLSTALYLPSPDPGDQPEQPGLMPTT